MAGLFRRPPYIASHHKRGPIPKGTQDVSVGLITQTATITDPTISRTAPVNFINQTATIHNATVSTANAIAVGLIEKTTRAIGTFYSEPFNGSSLSGDWAVNVSASDMPISVSGGNLVFTQASSSFGEIDATSNRDLTSRILSLAITQLDDGLRLGVGGQSAVDEYDGPECYLVRSGSTYEMRASTDTGFPSLSLGSSPPQSIQIRFEGDSWHYGYVSSGVLTEWAAKTDNVSITSSLNIWVFGYAEGGPADGAIASATSLEIYEASQVFGPTVTVGAVAASVGLIDQTAATFTPTVTPGAVSVLLGLIDQTATIAAASVGRNIDVGLVNQTAVISAATVSNLNTISVGLISQAATASAPTITTGAVNVALGRIDQTAQSHAPTITTGAVAADVGFINQTAQIHALTVLQQQFVSLGLINQSAATFDPTVTAGAVNVSVGLINQAAVANNPIVTTTATVSVAQIDATATINDPSVAQSQGIVLGQIDQTATAAAPTITTGAVAASVGLIDQTAQPRTPTVSTLNTVSVGLISQPVATFDLSISTANTIAVGQINRTAVTSAPSVQRGAVSVDLGLINQPAATFDPSLSATSVISVGLINQAAIAAQPAISITGDQNLDLGLINQSAVAYGIEVTGGAVTGPIRGAGRWVGWGGTPQWVPPPEDQRLTLATLKAQTRIFSPSVDVSDDEALLGLSEEDLLVLA